MSTLALHRQIESGIAAYKVKQVEFEHLVDAHGYKPTLNGLNEVSQSHEIGSLLANLEGSAGETEAFIGSLSVKSRGMMLTSSLLTGNASLYSSLRESVVKDLDGIYSQDLYSMLTDEFVPHTLVEMTKRAGANPENLAHFNASLTTLASTAGQSDALSSVREGLTSSAWIESNPNESTGLMSLVDAAPDSVEVGELKKSPLRLYLSKGLKLVTVGVVLASLGAGIVGGAALSAKSESIRMADLHSRPTISTMVSSTLSQARKIANYGEVTGLRSAGFYLKDVIPTLLHGDNPESIQGYASVYDKGDFDGDHDVCVVVHEQTATKSTDGHFYRFKDSPVLADKAATDFWFKSHETGHCLFNPSYGEATNLKQKLYLLNLKEVEADLAAIVDYARVTGTTDIYSNLIRPVRIVDLSDRIHRTAWALDEILPQLDLKSIHGMAADAVPGVVQDLMKKNFMGKDGSFLAKDFSYSGETDIGTPAADALWRETVTVYMYDADRLPGVKDKLKADIASTMSAHYAKYSDLADQSDLARAKETYSNIATKYKLPSVQSVVAKKAELSKHMDSFMDAFL
ncbi:hypothetical protein ACYPKM_03980 [Pseudomonas aeruginosa]